MWSGRESSTVNKYCLSLRKFLEFLYENDLPSRLPIKSTIAAEYIANLRLNNCTKGAIDSAIAALKWIHTFIPGINKWNNPMNDEFLAKLLSSAQRCLSKPKIQKKPLTGVMIKSIIDKSNLNDLIELKNCLIISFAYSLLLRHDEISHIACNHLTLKEEGIKIFIPKSKTDKYRNGKNVFLPKSESPCSTSKMLTNFLVLSNLKIGENHFLFSPIKKNGSSYSVTNKILAYSTYNDIVKNAISLIGEDPKLYGTHSCRSGGASDLAPHVSEHELLVSGRWSDARSIRSYVELDDTARFEMGDVLQSAISNSNDEDL